MFNRRRKRAASFYSDDIISVGELDANEVGVPVSRLCDNLGLEPAGEMERIWANPILAAGITHLAVDTPYGLERQPCLRADLVPLWLATISYLDVPDELRPKLELFQRECASVLWQAFKPQGFSAEDVLVPPPGDTSPAEAAYQTAMGMAVLARQQMLIERELNDERAERDLGHEQVIDAQTKQMAQAVRVVASSLATRTRRNEYGGVYQGLYRQFGITSLRNMPRGRFVEAMEWLDRWRGDIEGEPEPPPDI